MGEQVRKNIILVSFDDCIAYHRYKTAFREPIQTPNLDRITDVSANFVSAYCQVPLCGPSRASFMSARTPHELGIFNNEADVFERIGPRDIWSYKLKENGYFCSSGGKVHHGYKPLRAALHDVIYSDERKRFRVDDSLPDGVARRKYGGIRGGWGTTDEDDDGIFHDAQSADSAIEFLKTYDRDQPFYREVGFFSPHGPRYTPARYKDMYTLENVQRPDVWEGGFDENASSDEMAPQTPRLVERDDEWWRASTRNYFAALSHGDYHLGRVWDALKSSRFAENTLVLILSDHGFMLGARNRFYKSTLWEQSVGVPLIIHDPSQHDGRVITDPVALLDVGPTVLDYTGLPPLGDTVGRSLMPQVNGELRPDRVVPTFRFDNVSIRNGKYRFIRYRDGSTQLYDLEEDIWNLRDLGEGHPAHAENHRALVDVCKAYGVAPDIDATTASAVALDGKLDERTLVDTGQNDVEPLASKGPVADQIKRPLGAVTMVFEDYDLLKRWYDYYTAQIGAENLFVFSHGNDEEHRRIARGANVMNVPRDVALWKFDRRRWRMLSQFASGMLEFYSWMLVGDVDEFVVIDPDVAATLPTYLLERYSNPKTAPRSISPLGLNIVHVPEAEPLPIEEGSSVLSRRRFFHPSRVYSKPCLVREPVMFGPGGHRNNLGRRFLSDDLYLLHLKHYDVAHMQARAGRQKEMITAAVGENAEYEDGHVWLETEREYSDIRDKMSLGGVDVALPDIRAAMMKQKERYRDQFIWGSFDNDTLYQLPDRFLDLF